SVLVATRSGSIVDRAIAQEPGVRSLALRSAPHGELVRRVVWEATRLPPIVRRERCHVVISMSGILPRSAGYRLMCLLGNPVMYEQPTPANRLRQKALRRTAEN